MKLKISIIGKDFGFYFIEDVTQYMLDLKQSSSFDKGKTKEFFKEGIYSSEEVEKLNGEHFIFGFLESLYQSEKCPSILYDYTNSLYYKVERITHIEELVDNADMVYKRKINKKLIFILLSIILCIILITVLASIYKYIYIEEHRNKLNLDIEQELQYLDKPVIYLYPKEEQQISVELDYDGELYCTYPKYNNGWSVIAKPDGTLINKSDNKEYFYLFWEGIYAGGFQIPNGFVIEGKDTAEFLEGTLSYMGLTSKEYNDFIVYWLPKMQGNNYNLIYFAGVDYTDIAKLSITPEPDSIQRIFMVYKALDTKIDIEKQELVPFTRKGFTVIEWGGCEIK